MINWFSTMYLNLKRFGFDSLSLDFHIEGLFHINFRLCFPLRDRKTKRKLIARFSY